LIRKSINIYKTNTDLENAVVEVDKYGTGDIEGAKGGEEGKVVVVEDA
jgi:hypothetical protein